MKFDARDLRPDLGKIGLGGAGTTALADVTASPSPETPACQAALAGYRTALMFRVLFTSLVFAVGFASAAALVYAIARIMSAGVDLATGITGVSGFMGSGASLFLMQRTKESIAVARTALADVGKYCGVPTMEKVK